MGVLADALNALAKADCPVLLIGGNALPAFGISRATVDVDCLIATDSTEQLKVVLAANGFPHAGRMFSFHEFWHQGNPADPPIHAMFVDSATFEKMWSRSIPTEVSGMPLRVPCLAHFIVLKLFAIKSSPKRLHKDLRDVHLLLEANPGVVSRAELQEICERYASQTVVEELKRAGYL